VVILVLDLMVLRIASLY